MKGAFLAVLIFSSATTASWPAFASPQTIEGVVSDSMCDKMSHGSRKDGCRVRCAMCKRK